MHAWAVEQGCVVRELELGIRVGACERAPVIRIWFENYEKDVVVKLFHHFGPCKRMPKHHNSKSQKWDL